MCTCVEEYGNATYVNIMTYINEVKNIIRLFIVKRYLKRMQLNDLLRLRRN